jgi:hypothetical protein
LSKNAAMFLLVIIGTAGCAINDKGLVAVQYYECETGIAVRFKAWGIFASTSPVDPGLTIGFAWKAYLFPKQDITYEPSENLKLQILDLSKEKGRCLSKTNPPDSLNELGMPIAVLSKQLGVAMDFSSQRTGVMIGFRQANAIRIPSYYEGILFLKTDSVNLGKMQLFILKRAYRREDF